MVLSSYFFFWLFCPPHLFIIWCCVVMIINTFVTCSTYTHTHGSWIDWKIILKKIEMHIIRFFPFFSSFSQHLPFFRLYRINQYACMFNLPVYNHNNNNDDNDDYNYNWLWSLMITPPNYHLILYNHHHGFFLCVQNRLMTVLSKWIHSGSKIFVWSTNKRNYWTLLMIINCNWTMATIIML